jgi:hypothetical protein
MMPIEYLALGIAITTILFLLATAFEKPTAKAAPEPEPKPRGELVEIYVPHLLMQRFHHLATNDPRGTLSVDAWMLKLAMRELDAGEVETRLKPVVDALYAISQSLDAQKPRMTADA